MVIQASTVDEILEIIEVETARFMSNSFDTVVPPFPISPLEYLRFAEDDLREDSKRARVNALSNAKRSLDSRVESILYALGLQGVVRKKGWSVPRKLASLSDLGVLTPRILTKLNRARNLVEHEFHCPDREQVEDFVDVVALFYESTKIYLSNLPNDAEIECSESGRWVAFHLHRDPARVVLARGAITIEQGDPNYERLVIGYARIISRLYE